MVLENKFFWSLLDTSRDKPFFWLGDTAWMLFTNISYEEAYTYLKNRADKGFNVIQAVLINNAQNKLV